MDDVKLGFVVGEFNADITELMLQRAKAHAAFLECAVTHIMRVPGAFDTALAIKKMMERSDIDAVVVLGAVLEGDTDHDEIVAQHAARKMIDLSLEYGKPIGLGMSGPGMTRAQGQSRIDDYARRGVEAAVKLCKRIRLIEKKDAPELIG